MQPLPIDPGIIDECRRLAAEIAEGVHRFIDAHTTASIERTVLRAYGIDGADAEGVPLVNTAVERYLQSGRGIASFLGRALRRGAANPQQAAEELAWGAIDDGSGGASPEELRAVLAPHTRAA